MSDYENEDWDDIDLKATQITPPTLDETFSHYVAHEEHQKHASGFQKSNNSAGKRPTQRPRFQQTFHPLIQNIRPKTHQGLGGRNIQSASEPQSRRTKVEAYKRKETSGGHAEHEYELAVSWKAFVNNIRDFEISQAETAHNMLDSICMASQAYIEPQAADADHNDSNKLLLWGSEEQCSDAIIRLRAWELKVRAPAGKHSKGIWTKERAFDGRQQHRSMQAQMLRYEDDAFQMADDSSFDYEAYLFWPSGFDLDGYLTQYDPNVLRGISSSFRCRFTHGKQEKHEEGGRGRYTRLQAETEGNLIAAYQRLVNLAKEMVAQRNKGVHGNFFRLPTVSGYRDRVSIMKDGSNPVYLIRMHGDPINDGDEATTWPDLHKLMESRNRKEIRTSLDSFLRSFHVSQSHARLRAEFGAFGLVSFKKPDDGADSYFTDSFLHMIQNPRTELTNCVLRADGKDMYQLLDVISAMDEFSNPIDAYKAAFDFQSADYANKLCLETEFQRGFDEGEAEVSAQRWLTSKTHLNSQNVFGVKVLDLERPSYTLRVDSHDLFKNETVLRDMISFQANIGFRPPSMTDEGLKSHPKRRAIFPPGERRLTAVTETVSKKFRFRDTDGTFEIRREDVYDHRPGHEGSFPVFARWKVAYYYSEWDALLGDFANLNPGEAVTWSQELKTLFPEVVDQDLPRALPRGGFKGFMREINEIQGLLAKALDDLPVLKPTIVGGRIKPKPKK